jgi:ABC-type uncharacterized transport system ATPase subunit
MVRTGLVVNAVNRRPRKFNEGGTMIILQTHSLTRKFGSITAVDAMTIDVEEGEFFGLLGPNGAGKTTAIKKPFKNKRKK